MSPALEKTNDFNTVAGKKSVGILALQGDFYLHSQALKKLGIASTEVRTPEDLATVQKLIIPGGESSALLRLTKPLNMLDAISLFAKNGGSIFGTCAGAILLAKTVSNPSQQSLGIIDIVIERNSYGRQLESREVVGSTVKPFGEKALPMVFIRAPRITAIAETVTLLADYDQEVVLVQQGRHIAATFHPELTEDLSIYEYWLQC